MGTAAPGVVTWGRRIRPKLRLLITRIRRNRELSRRRPRGRVLGGRSTPTGANWVARQRIAPHLPIHGLRDSFGTWVYEEYGVKQAQEWLGHSDPATTLRHCVRLTTAARAKAVAGLDEVTRAALEPAQSEQAAPVADNVVELAGPRRLTR